MTYSYPGTNLNQAWLSSERYVEQFDAKPSEIKTLFTNPQDPTRTAEPCDSMLTVGLPI